MGDVGDLRGAVFMSAMDTFQRGYREEVVRVPIWYHDEFMHWAWRVMSGWVRSPTPIQPLLSRPDQSWSWCGIAGCPYPYVTTGSFSSDSARRAPVETPVVSRSPISGNYRTMRPRWGAFIVDRSLGAWGGLNENGEEIIEVVKNL